MTERGGGTTSQLRPACRTLFFKETLMEIFNPNDSLVSITETSWGSQILLLSSLQVHLPKSTVIEDPGGLCPGRDTVTSPQDLAG